MAVQGVGFLGMLERADRSLFAKKFLNACNMWVKYRITHFIPVTSYGCSELQRIPVYVLWIFPSYSFLLFPYFLMLESDLSLWWTLVKAQTCHNFCILSCV